MYECQHLSAVAKLRAHPPSIARPRGVLFDIGGVLERMDDELSWLTPYASHLGIDPADLVRVVYGQVDPDGAMATGGVPEAEYRQRLAAALGLSVERVEGVMGDHWNWYCGELNTEMLEYAARLRPRYRVGILSNSRDGARREEELRYGFSQVFDPIVYSDEIGVAKPDPRAYLLACEQMQLAPHEVVFLDDVPFCVEGASAAGLVAVLHQDSSSSIATLNRLLGEPAAAEADITRD